MVNLDRDWTASSPDSPAGEVQFLLKNHTTYGVILWAIGESAAIYGLVLTFTSGDMRYVAGFAVYSLANLLFFRPQKSAFEEQARRLRRYLGTGG